MIDVLGSLLIALLTFGSFPQANAEKLTLSITVPDAHFTKGQNSRVHLKIKCGPLPGAKAKTFDSVWIRMNRSRRAKSYCTRDDCFGATYRLSSPLPLEEGQLIELDIDMNELYWADIILSVVDPSEPKNMAQVIGPGSYFLYVTVNLQANSTSKSPQTVEASSNSITVEMK